MTSNEAISRELATARSGLGSEPPPFNERPSMHHTWASLSFLHWPYDPKDLQRLLSPGLVADTHDGRGYVGLILFHLTVRPAWLPAIPWLCSFAETNVRTYVRGPAASPASCFSPWTPPALAPSSSPERHHGGCPTTGQPCGSTGTVTWSPMPAGGAGPGRATHPAALCSGSVRPTGQRNSQRWTTSSPPAGASTPARTGASPGPPRTILPGGSPEAQPCRSKTA